jgi:hypothetical protein
LAKAAVAAVPRVQVGAPVLPLEAHLRVARQVRFCVTIRRNFQEVAAKVARVGQVLVIWPPIFLRVPARAVAEFSAQVFLTARLDPALAPGRDLTAVEFSDRLDQVKAAAELNGRRAPVKAVAVSDLIVPEAAATADFGPIVREVVAIDPAKAAAEFGLIAPVDPVRMAVAFVRIDLADRAMMDAPVDLATARIVLAKAAAASDGTATIGATGPISGPIAFPIATSGTTGETIDASTSRTTGTTIGMTTITGSTKIGGVITTFTIRTTTTSTIGVGRRGRR